ncbi:MAG TPA: hypothetical protein VGE57_13810 [Solimonas sp.]
MRCAAADPSGQIFATTEQPPSCVEYLLLSEDDYDALRNPFGAEPDFSVVGWAFGASMLIWSIGLSIGLIVATIKKAR